MLIGVCVCGLIPEGVGAIRPPLYLSIVTNGAEQQENGF